MCPRVSEGFVEKFPSCYCQGLQGISQSLVLESLYNESYMGGYGPFLDPYYNTAPNI